jgi:hypothetical protein
MEPIGFAVSLLPILPQEIILVHSPGDLQFTQYTHFHINDWTVLGGYLMIFFNSPAF